MHLLLIEDNPDLLINLYDYFEPMGYQIDSARDGISGLNLAMNGDYDIIVLDLTLPRLDGLSVCQQLRKNYHCATPILILTARGLIEQRVSGLEAGADDYLTKPFSLMELEARIKALVRRAQGKHATMTWQWLDLQVSSQLPQAIRDGQVITLTPIAHQILLCLIRSAPHIVPKRILERELWCDTPPDSGALRTHIHTLRQQIDKEFAIPLIETVHGVGYRLSSLSQIP